MSSVDLSLVQAKGFRTVRMRLGWAFHPSDIPHEASNELENRKHQEEYEHRSRVDVQERG